MVLLWHHSKEQFSVPDVTFIVLCVLVYLLLSFFHARLPELDEYILTRVSFLTFFYLMLHDLFSLFPSKVPESRRFAGTRWFRARPSVPLCCGGAAFKASLSRGQ